jgi:hypothetical protein
MTAGPRQRYSAHPSLARMGGGEKEARDYLRAAPGYVDAMYASAREALRPLHDALEALAFALGDESRLCPGKTIVPVYRNHVRAAAVRWKPAGMRKHDRITHRVAITGASDIDAEVETWLHRAFDLDRGG